MGQFMLVAGPPGVLDGRGLNIYVLREHLLKLQEPARSQSSRISNVSPEGRIVDNLAVVDRDGLHDGAARRHGSGCDRSHLMIIGAP